MRLEKVHPECRAFVEAIETLLHRRQQELERDELVRLWYFDEWGPRTWTRTEMEDMVYSSYKQMLRGRITRPPRRQTVMDIADYLNCTVDERNHLLATADIAPVEPFLTGDALTERLEPTIAVAQAIDIPAMVINRDWGIHFINAKALLRNECNFT